MSEYYNWMIGFGYALLVYACIFVLIRVVLGKVLSSMCRDCRTPWWMDTANDAEILNSQDYEQMDSQENVYGYPYSPVVDAGERPESVGLEAPNSKEESSNVRISSSNSISFGRLRC